MRNAFAAPVLLVLLVAANGQFASAQTPRRIAVLVGVEDYEHERLRSPKLKYPIEDVTEFGAILKEHGYDVALLTDDEGAKDPLKQPNKENIERICSAMLKGAKRSDTVVLAFAGHGLQFAADKDAYFCPSDARPFADKKDSLVSLSKIYGELDSSFAGVKLILVDACRNDPDPTRGRSAGVDADSAPAPPKGVAALFSCSAGEKAFENDALKHGVFFHYVIEGLKSEDLREKSGEIRFERLSSYVRDQVPTKVAEISGGREQSPNLKADIAGRPPILLPKRVELAGPPKVAEAKPAAKPEVKAEMKNEVADSEKKIPSGSTARSAGDVQEFTDLKIKFCYCPPGKFLMGSPIDEKDREEDEDDTAGKGGSQVEVILTKGFWLGQTEVTQKQWFDVMGTQPWDIGLGFSAKEGDTIAVSYISYEDAMRFCEKLNEVERTRGRLKENERYTLPTEAQWEYACRAGTKTRYSFGNDKGQLGDYAWWGGGLFGRGSAKSEPYAHAVAQKKPNPWGLYDLHGNCWEWCVDAYQDHLLGGRDPHNDNEGTGSKFVSRGGTVCYDPEELRSANRFRTSRDFGDSGQGFRLCRTDYSVLEEIAESKPEMKNGLADSEKKAPASGSTARSAGDVQEFTDLKIKFCYCPPGTFLMGSPKSKRGRRENEDDTEGIGGSQVAVTLKKGFWLGQTEVTQRQYYDVMKYSPWKTSKGELVAYAKEGDDYAASYISYYFATRFCETLTERERLAGRLKANERYTLPTEAQWEYACRAGTKTAFNFGEDESRLGDSGWFGAAPDNEKIRDECYAHVVGRKRQNPWGFFDMHGNVSEWCLDMYHEKLERVGDDPFTGKTGDFYVLRGGSWGYESSSLRSASRSGDLEDKGGFFTGFRLCLAESPALAKVTAPKPAMNGAATDSEKKIPSGSTSRSAGEVQEFTDLKIKFCYCPPGKFLMGSPSDESLRGEDEDDTAGRGGKQVEVMLTKGFWLSQTEVTQKQWSDVVGIGPWKDRNGSPRYDAVEGTNYPASYVSYGDAMTFCKLLTDRERSAGRLQGEQQYTLPTEAQWEYACRAGTKTAFSFTEEGQSFGDFVWYSSNTPFSVGLLPHVVGQKKANLWGLRDMHGNMSEWCLDVYQEKLTGGRNPLLSDETSSHSVLRGGSYKDFESGLRSARRAPSEKRSWEGYIGFRVCRTE